MLAGGDGGESSTISRAGARRISRERVSHGRLLNARGVTMSWLWRAAAAAPCTCSTSFSGPSVPLPAPPNICSCSCGLVYDLGAAVAAEQILTRAVTYAWSHGHGTRQSRASSPVASPPSTVPSLSPHPSHSHGPPANPWQVHS